MNVFLTVDVECYRGDHEREVWGQGLGLPFLLDTCRLHSLPMTAFVEALGTTRWGDGETRRICRALLENGHEVQLHLHPVVAHLEGFSDSDDVLWRHDRKTQARLLRTGIDALIRCGAPAITAFRAGDFAADERTLRALMDTGIRISSNRDPDTKCSTRSRINELFPVRHDLSAWNGLLDLPVSALRSPLPQLDGRYRHLEVSAVGSDELHDALVRMHRAGYVCATLLTHPGEFFRIKNGRCVPVLKNRRRWDRLLAFLKSRAEFNVRTVDACGRTIHPPSVPPVELRLALTHSLRRVMEQGIDRLRRHME